MHWLAALAGPAIRGSASMAAAAAPRNLHLRNPRLAVAGGAAFAGCAIIVDMLTSPCRPAIIKRPPRPVPGS
jgi:hypothetical protein